MDISSRLNDLAQPTGEEDLLAVKYPQPRLRIDPKHGLWVAVACVIGVCAFLVLRGQPDSYTFTPASGNVSVPTSATMPTIAVVSVVGEVQRPGLVTLSPGARINDAIQNASPLESADLLRVNLAEKVADGKQIVVPAKGVGPGAPGAPAAAGQASGAPAGDGKVSLNSATAADLEKLDGVGAKTAEAIVKHRESIGGFSSIEQLQDVKGIGPAKFAAIKPDVTL